MFDLPDLIRNPPTALICYVTQLNALEQYICK